MLDGRSAGQELRGATSSAYSLWPRFHLRQNSRRAATSHLQQSIDEARIGSGQLACSSISCCCSKARSTHVVTCPAEQLQIETGRADLGRAQGLAAWRSGSQSRARKPPSSPPPSAGQTQQQQPQQHLQAQRQRKEPLQDGPLPPGVSSAAAPVPAPGPAAGESRSSFPQPTGGLQAGFRSTTGVRQSATATSDAAATGGEGADAGLVSEGSGPEGLGLVASLANIGQLPAQQRSLQPPPQQQLQQQQEGAIGARSSDSSSSSSASFTSTSASAARNAAAWPLDAPLLTHRIGACSSWRELSSLVSQHAPRMNAVHVTAVATRLARFSPPLPAVRDDGGGGGGVDADVSGDGNSVESQQQRRRFRQMRRWQRGQEDEELHEWMSFVRSILALVERHAAILDARGIANISWALARALPAPLLQPPSPVVAAVAVAAGAEVGSSETGGQCDMGTAAAAGVAAGMGPRRGEDRAVGLRRRRHHGGDGVAGDEGDGSGEWRQPGGSCTAGGGGEAPAAVRFSALRAAARHTVGRLLALPAADPGEWSKTRERESCRSGGGIMTPRHIANAMWAAASLGVLSAPGPEGREAAAEGLVRQGSTHGGGSGDVEGPRRWVMRALAAARGALRTGGFTEEGISQLVWSVSELGLTPDAAWMEDFYGAARRQASELSAHSAANVLLSLANMATAAAGGHRDGDDDVDDDATDTPAGLAESHLTGRRNRIDSGRANSSGAVAATAPAAVAFLLPSDSWLLSFLVDTAPSLESADPVSLANSVWALSVLMRVRRSQLAAASPLPRSLSPPPPSCWLRHLYGALSQPATLRRFTDAQLGQLVWSLADLSDVRPGGLPLVPSAGMFGLVAAELRRRLVAMADKHFAMASWGMQRLQLRLEQRQHLLQLRQLEEELLQLRPEVEELPRRKRGLIAAAAAAAADRDPDDQQQEQKQLASHVRHSYGRELASSAYSDGQNADWSSAWLAAAEKRMPYMADRWLLLTLQVAAASGECFATAASASSGDGDAVLAWFAVATDAVLLPPRRRMGHLPTPAGTDMGRQSQQHCGDSRMAAGSSATAVSAAAATAIASLGQLLDDQPPSGDGVAAAAATQGGGSGGTNPSGTTPALDGVGPDSRTTASSSSSSRRRRRLLPRLLQALLLAAEACLPPGPALSAVMAAAAAEVLAATLAVHPSGSEGGGGGGAEEATSWTVTELLRCGAALARAGYEPPPAWRQAFFGRVLQLAGVSTAAAAPPPQELRPSHPGFAEATVPSESDRYAAGLPDQASSATAGSADGPDGEDQGPEQQQRRRRQQPLRRHRHGHHLSASDVGLLLSCSQRWAATASDATLAALLYGVPYELWTPRAAAWVCRLLASQVTTQQPQLQQQGLMQQQKQLSPFERNTQGLEQGSAHPLPDQLQPSLPPPSPPPQQQQPCDEGVAHNNNNNNRITSGSGSGGSAGLKAADPFRCEGPATASEALQDPSLTAASPASPLLDQSSAELDPACTQPAAIQGPPPAAPPPPLPEGSVLASSAAAAAATSSAAAAKLDWDVDSDVEDLDCNTGVNGGTRKVAVREYDVVLVAPRPRPLLPGGLMAAGTDGSGSSSSNARGPFPKAGAAGSLSSRAGAAVPDLNGDAAAAASDGPLGEGKGNGGGDGDLPAPASEAGAAVLPYTPGADGAGARRVEVLQRGPGRPAAAAALVTASAAAAQPLWLATGFQPVGAHPHTRGSAMASATAASSSSSAASLPSRPIWSPAAAAAAAAAASAYVSTWPGDSSGSDGEAGVSAGSATPAALSCLPEDLDGTYGRGQDGFGSGISGGRGPAVAPALGLGSVTGPRLAGLAPATPSTTPRWQPPAPQQQQQQERGERPVAASAATTAPRFVLQALGAACAALERQHGRRLGRHLVPYHLDVLPAGGGGATAAAPAAAAAAAAASLLPSLAVAAVSPVWATAAAAAATAAPLDGSWSTFSLSQLLWAAARLRLRPSPRQRAVLRITLSAALVRWAAQPPYALIPLLWSCRRLGVPLGAGPTRLLRRALLLHPGLQPAALADGPLLMLLEALLGWRLDPPMEWSRRVPYRLASWLARASPAVAIATAAASPTFAGKLGFRGARWAARTDAGAVGSAAKVGRDSVGPTDSGGRSNSSSNNSGGGGVVEARQLLLVLRALRRLQNAARSEAAGSGGDDDDTRHIGFSRRDGGPQAAPGLRIAAGGSIDADVSSAAPGARPYFFRLQLPPRWSPSWAPVPPSKLATRGSRHGRCRSTPAATLTPLDDALWPELWPMLRIAVRQRLTEVFGLTPGVAAPPATSPRERLAALMCGAACGLVDWEAWGVAAMRRLAGELPPRDYHAWLALAVGLQFRVTRGTLEDLLLAWCIASGPQLDAMSPRQLHTTLRLAGRVAETLLQPLSFDWVSVALRRYSRCITALPPAQLAQVPAVLRRLRRLPPPQWQASYAQLVVRHALPYMSGRSAQAMLRAAGALSPELAAALRGPVHAHMTQLWMARQATWRQRQRRRRRQSTARRSGEQSSEQQRLRLVQLQRQRQHLRLGRGGGKAQS